MQSPFQTTIAKLASGAWTGLFAGAQKDLAVSAMHGSKYNQSVNGNLFAGANQAGVTTSVALATTYLGCCLSNPAGSFKNLVLRRVGVTFNVVFAAFNSIGLISGYAAGGIIAHTTPLTVQNSKIGASAAAAVGKLDAACTLVGTPAWYQWLTSTPTATSSPARTVFEMEGGIVIPPGGYIAIGTLTASPASSFLGSMEWEEVPVLV